MEAVASPSQQRWQKRILALCWVSYALSYLCRTKLSIALPEMTAQLHWSAAKKVLWSVLESVRSAVRALAAIWIFRRVVCVKNWLVPVCRFKKSVIMFV